MSKLILFEIVTLDGFFADEEGTQEWHKPGKEVDAFALEQMKTAKAMVFGRKTHEYMATYWPTEKGIQAEPEIAGYMNKLPKIVFSRNGRYTKQWQNSRLAAQPLKKEIESLKKEYNGNIFVFGSADLVDGLVKENLIDEFRLLVNPEVIVEGIPLFKSKISMKLSEIKSFPDNEVLMIYTK